MIRSRVKERKSGLMVGCQKMWLERVRETFDKMERLLWEREREREREGIIAFLFVDIHGTLPKKINEIAIYFIVSS